MKTKNGKIILGAKDTRLGNFVLTDQPEHYKIADINARFSTQVHKTTLTGRIITLALGGKMSENYLNNLCVTLYETALTAHDTESMQGVIAACRGAISRHPELYGASKDGDEKALEEVKAVQEVIESATDEKGKD